MKKPRIQLVRSRDGAVWHLQEGTRAACGATLRFSITISGYGTPAEVIEVTRDKKRSSGTLPLCPMCF